MIVKRLSGCFLSTCVVLSSMMYGYAHAQTAGTRSGSETSTYTEPSPDRKHRDRGGSFFPWIVVPFGNKPTKNKIPDAQQDIDLDQNGPEFPESYLEGTFPIRGYTRGGWPVVVDFLSQPDTCTWLEIHVDKQPEYTIFIDSEGRDGRRLIKVELPEDLAPSPEPAMYVLHSEHPACPAGLRQEGRKHYPAPIKIYGIGGGPQAIGSVAIDHLQFGPSNPLFPKVSENISFQAKSKFNHATIEVLRFENDGGQIKTQRVSTRRVDALPLGDNKSEPWDGKTDSGEPSFGLHRVQVRAWFTADDKSWVGAVSPDSVDVEKE